MELPRELTEGATLRGREYAWSPDTFPSVLARAESLGFACLGGQFQFRTPDSTCEMYWLNADAADRSPNEAWDAYVARSSAEVLSAFSMLHPSTDFRAEALRWPDIPQLSGSDATPEQYLCFVAYFVPERSPVEFEARCACFLLSPLLRIPLQHLFPTPIWRLFGAYSFASVFAVALFGTCLLYMLVKILKLRSLNSSSRKSG